MNFTEKVRKPIYVGDIIAKSQFSKWQLFQALAGQCSMNQGASTININGINVILHGIQREDGSGKSFILTVSHAGEYYQSHCRTND